MSRSQAATSEAQGIASRRSISMGSTAWVWCHSRRVEHGFPVRMFHLLQLAQDGDGGARPAST